MAEYLEARGIYYPNELRSIHKSSEKLQPIYEAFTNAWESVQEKYTADFFNLGEIGVEFYYNVGLFEDDPENKTYTLDRIVVADNGGGLNEASFERLKTLRDDSKSKNNKGTGRVQYLHFFDDTIFDSVFKDKDGTYRHMVLTLSKKESFLKQKAILRKDVDEISELKDSYAKVEFKFFLDVKNDAKFYNELPLDALKSELIIHFLSKFCESRDKMPQIELKRFENGELVKELTIKGEDIPTPEYTQDVEVHYSKLGEKNKVEDSLKTEQFTLLSFVQPKERLAKNSIYFVSNGALAQEEKVDGLQKTDVINDNRYLFLLRGDYFNEVEDDLRGNLHLVKESEFKKQSEDNLFPEECLLVDNIRLATNQKIATLYKEFKEKRDEAMGNLETLQKMFLLDEVAINKVRKTLKTSDSDEKILQTIYEADTEVAAKRDADIKQRYERLKKLSPEEDDYQEKLSEEVSSFVRLVPLQNRTNVTKHIARRKLVLEIFDMIMQKELEKLKAGGRVDEDLLHNLIFQQHSTNPKDSDLWLLDDQYLYFEGCSEKYLDKIKINGTKLIKEKLTEDEEAYKVRQLGDKTVDVGDRRPDIMLYPAEGKCILIEFKAPDVDVSEYLDQINRYAMVINNLSDEKFSFHAFYGYLIGETVEYDFIEENNSAFKQAPYLKFLFRPSYDLPGRFGRPSGDLYTEIIKYSDILKRAQLRNKILMEKLEEKPEVEIAAEHLPKKKKSKKVKGDKDNKTE